MIDYSYLSIQNPWWENPSNIDLDDKLVEFSSLKYQFIPNNILDIKPRSGDINIITGPRQTGKSTAVKLYIQKQIKNGFPSTSILFFNCDALSDQKDLIDLITNFTSEKKGEKLCIFLDEITSVESWPQAIKWLVDVGILKNSAVFLTGSSSISFKKSGEFLPGRRGKGKDVILLPIGFEDYLKLYKVKKQDRQKNLEKFLITGGLLRNINYGVKTNIDLYLATLRSELFKNGRKEDFLKEVVRKLLNSLSSQTSYTNIAEEAELGSKNTAIDYLSFLTDSFFLKEAKFFDISRQKVILKKNKKYYTTDPYFVWMFMAFIFGEEGFLKYPSKYSLPAEKGKLIENFIASELTKKGVDFYFTQNTNEVDFIVPNLKVAIEVKYKDKITKDDLYPLEQVDNKYRKILISKNLESKQKGIEIVPASSIVDII